MTLARLPRLALLLALSCGSSEAATFPLDGTSDVLPGFRFETGQQPPAGPVRLSLAITGDAAASVHADAVAAGDAAAPELYQVGDGTITLDGGFALDGQLLVEVAGLPKYDGDIPGLADVRIPFSNTAAFQGFGIGASVVATADLPPSDLPPIPLPGGLPGTLNLSVAAGSTLSVTLETTCAGITGDEAELRGTLLRGGTLVLGARVELDVPFVGKQTFPIGDIPVTLPTGTIDVRATGTIGEVGDAPAGAVASAKTCSSDGGTGGAGGAGSTATSTSASASGSTSVTSTTASSVSSTASTGGPACDASCSACKACEIAPTGACAAEAQACSNNAACVDFATCASMCPDDDPATPGHEYGECIMGSGASCLNVAPGGYEDATALVDCLTENTTCGAFCTHKEAWSTGNP